MRLMTLTMCVLAVAAGALAQETGIEVRAIRVLAADPEALATFYEKAFGMSETRRPANTPTFKEIVVNSGSTAERAKKSTATPIVIATRPKDAPAGAMAALILAVPNLERAIEAVKANGGTLLRPPNTSQEGLSYAFVKDPDGNQIELLVASKL
jgi:predicted enzyme related to lactoylglutathione lyase